MAEATDPPTAARGPGHAQNKPKARGRAANPHAREGMSWMGVLTEDELSKLHADFDEMLLCPGCTGSFGHSVDKDARIFLPGAAVGYKETRRILTSWQTKIGSNEKFSWWRAAVEQERDMSALKGSHLLSGLAQQDWAEYTAVYRRLAASGAHQSARERKRARARERFAQSTQA